VNQRASMRRIVERFTWNCV